jgi:hypothetical protein
MKVYMRYKCAQTSAQKPTTGYHEQVKLPCSYLIKHLAMKTGVRVEV